MAVCEDRVEGCRQILQLHPDTQLVILDDAYQHRRLRCTASILLTSYYRPFTHDRFLPLGTLRDAVQQRSRAGIVILTKAPSDCQLPELLNLGQSLVLPRQSLYITSLRYSTPIPLFPHDADFEKGTSAGAVAGIANPVGFFAHLEGITRLEFKLQLRDHAPYTPSVLSRLERMGRLVDRVYTTMKDAARLRDALPPDRYPSLRGKLWVVPIALHWRYGDEESLVHSLCTQLGIGHTVTE